MLDFGALPPEVNSGLMYSGPGSGSLIAAASAWDAIASQLDSVAAGYSSVVAELTGQTWSGGASVAMATAVAPYVAWMTTTAAQAEQAAGQARAAVAAYETAFAATVPPAMVAANRAQLAMLVATNFFGQNTPMIAATEAQYAQMWAQDSVAMYGYAASSSVAATLTPFSEPPQTTSATGQSAQAATVAQAVGTSTAAHTQTTLAGVTSAASSPLQGLSPAGTSGAAAVSGLSTSSTPVLDAFGAFNTLTGPAGLASNFSRTSTSAMSGFTGIYRSGIQAGSGAAKAAVPAPPVTAAGFGSVGEGGGALGGLGRAASVGGLSVPPNWTAATPVAGAAHDPIWLSEPDVGALSSEPVAGMLGGPPGPRSMAGAAARPTVNNVLRVGPRRFTMPRPFAAG